MDMVMIVHPTLEEYHERVTAMARKYGRESWLSLTTEEMSTDDSFEYSFIVSSVGDKLVHREFLDMSQTPGIESMPDEMMSEPGHVPGSFIFRGVTIGCPAVCGIN
jgi:hypothetical protein